MGRIDIILDDKFEEKFRQEVARRLGFKKGNITKAVEDALRDWIKKE
jgi:hypothetical protein